MRSEYDLAQDDLVPPSSAKNIRPNRGRLNEVTGERDALATERRATAEEFAEIRKRLDRLERPVDPRKR